MGGKNSSLTRVKPLFDIIKNDAKKLNEFFKLFNRNIPEVDQNSIMETRYGTNEKKIPPPKLLLVWMLNNLDKLNSESLNSNVKNTETLVKRKKLFTGDKEILNEALKLIDKNYPQPMRYWYIFEGYTQPDIYIETTDSIFIGEAKRTESDITTSTKWLNQRDQLIRHIDSLLDQSKNIYSFYILEKGEYEKGKYKKSMELYEKPEYFESNLESHRESNLIMRAFNSYKGYIFWEDIAQIFNINFPDTIDISKKK